jgi:hypothetical protein
MSPDPGKADPAQPERAPLPRRDPRPLWVHAAVDVVVAFLALVIVLLILNVSIVFIVIVAVVAGVAAAPFTQRAEGRALAARPAADSTEG